MFEVLATGGDSPLGGDDFDHAIAEWFCTQHGIDGLAALPLTAHRPAPSAQRSLLAASRKVNEILSQADTAVLLLTGADGSALIARTLSATKRVMRDAKLTLDDVTGIVLVGGLVEKIIPRNSTLPIARAQEFTTFKDGQTAMSLHVVQGEREAVADCRSLARFELRGIPAAVAGAVHIRVSFQIDADGLLSVTAREQSTGIEAHIEVKPTYGLADTQIASMLQEAIGASKTDMQLRTLREAQVDARRMLDATEAALITDAALLSATEIKTIRQAMFGVGDMLETEAPVEELRAATVALGAVTDEFAARRMNASISQALAGRAMDSLA